MQLLLCYLYYILLGSIIYKPDKLPYQQQTGGKHSKAIKIVNPETTKEVDISNLKSMSPTSHSSSKSTTESGLQTIETSVESRDEEVCYIAKKTNVIANYVPTNTILQSYCNMHMYVSFIYYVS